MVYRRRYRKGKGRKGRKRGYKKYPMYRKMTYMTNHIHKYKRSFEAASLVVPANGIAQSVYSVSLSNIPSPTDFTNLYDMYRISGVLIKFVPVYDAALSSAINKFSLFTVIDYNDLNTITQVQAEEYQNVRQTYSTKVHMRYFKPRIAITQQDVSTTSFIASYKTPWISTLNTNIAHGFLKYVTDTNTGSAAFTFNVYVTLYLQFKNVN